ncbi:uncharacterized protein LOC129746066 [Uranotaenia lowii]|uniref:uncharacterized protein LOC129746066 n=1 Tax=Uranotaenia lowii TaxID=190385 RepID=UPI00247AF8EF|nr:uncharacterized protein LOC129746066 [Uranotaenia lowii]
MPIGNIDRVLVELRPRLQSANFFILFSIRFAEIRNTKIDLGSDRIIISTQNNDERYELRMGDYFKLHTQTLSSLLIKNNYICFRINTNENKFHSEVLAINEYNACTNLRLECALEVNVNYKIVCSNCENPLNEQPVAFDRILELPSDTMDSSDWYCHKHPHQNGSSEGNTENEVCSSKAPHSSRYTPTEQDLYYGPFYALLDGKHMKRVHLKADRFFYCKRCLQYLGIMKRNQSAKIWYENLRFEKQIEKIVEPNTVSMSLFKVEQNLAHFQYLVRKTVNDFNFISHLGLPPIFKIIFEMRRPGLNGDVFYMLMQIMDANLNVFKISQPSSDSEDSSSSDHSSSSQRPQTSRQSTDDNEVDDSDDNEEEQQSSEKVHKIIHLDRHRAMKVMYRYEKFDHQPIIDFWMQDYNVVNVEISEQMFRTAVRYLDSNSNYVPECYRHNLGFTLSYLDIT